MVEFFDSFCPEKPTPPHAHHWVEASRVDRGAIFVCKYCLRSQWWPTALGGAMLLTEMMSKFGVEEGYDITIDEFPVAKKTLTYLRNIRRIGKVVKDGEQLARIIIAMEKEGSNVEEGA